VRWPPTRPPAIIRNTRANSGVAVAQKSGLLRRRQHARRALQGVVIAANRDSDRAEWRIYAAWRRVFAGSMREKGFTMSRDGGKTFAP
jgi:hypothetical protein